MNCKIILFSAAIKDEVKVLWESMNIFSHSLEFSFSFVYFSKFELDKIFPETER